MWLGLSFEVAFEDKSDDKIYDGEANGISDYSSNCSCPVRIVKIQLRIHSVFYLQDGESEYPRPHSHPISSIHAPKLLSNLLSAFPS